MKPLRLLPLLVFFCCLFTTTRAQYVTIPDTAFVSWLQTNYPGCMNGNQMDTTCTAITTATNILIANEQVKDFTGIQYFDNLINLASVAYSLEYIPAFPASLSVLNLADNYLTALPPLPAGLTSLTVRNNALASLPALPSTLVFLDCSFNPLTLLPALPASLVDLNCSHVLLDALPALPIALNRLNVYRCALDSMPALPASLRILDCSFNDLVVLPALSADLRELTCGNIQLSALPSLPDSLTRLVCVWGAFVNLPPLPSTLQHLEIQNTPITSVPALPAGLNTLNLSGTQLVSLPALPQGLRSVITTYNPLTSLPALPGSLEYLDCMHNHLTSLPALPDALYSLYCGFNDLTSLPELPDSMVLLSCPANPYMRCLPRFKYIEQLEFDDSAVLCIPNLGNVRQSSPPLNTKPLCDPLNAGGCAVYWNISGNVYNDRNANCVKDNGEGNVALVKVKLQENGTTLQQTYTSLYGTYAFETDAGDYTLTIDTSGVPFDIVCPAGGLDSISITLLDSIASMHNFALQCKPGFDVGVQHMFITDRARPASVNTIYVWAGDVASLYGQTCNTASLSGQLVLTVSGPAKYVSPAPNALTPVVSGNTLTYTVNDWSTINSGAFDFNIQVDTTAQAGQQICFDATVTPTVGDNNPANNQLTYCVTVVNSYDPNDKAVYPVSNVDITGDKWLTYTVRFQNTGNAPAEHIYITDTIDTDVDIETFQLLAYSFQPQVIIKGNAVRFNFANINLPDSVNDEPNSHGYVQYKVKVKDNATVGTVINNTAFIYFDFNAPVVTNTTTNTLTLPNGITSVANSTATLQLYANPANDMVMVSLSDNLTGGTLNLSDITGRSLNTVPVASTHAQLSTANLSSGVYLVTVVKGEVRVVKRLVVGR